jgi:hypothetical protein
LQITLALRSLRRRGHPSWRTHHPWARLLDNWWRHHPWARHPGKWWYYHGSKWDASSVIAWEHVRVRDFTGTAWKRRWRRGYSLRRRLRETNL